MLKELVAGCSHHGNKGHEFLEVTFPISITVQDVHDFVHSLLLFDFLKEKAVVPDLFLNEMSAHRDKTTHVLQLPLCMTEMIYITKYKIPGKIVECSGSFCRSKGPAPDQTLRMAPPRQGFRLQHTEQPRGPGKKAQTGKVGTRSGKVV